MIRRIMAHESKDLFAVIAITLVAVALIFLVPAENVAGRIWALPLVLLLPGYALTSALFARRSLGIAECCLCSMGMTLVVIILGGLLLNITPFGLRATSWAIYLSAITLGASAAALVRRDKNMPASARLKIGNIRLTFRHGLLLGLAALIAGGALAISIVGAKQQPYPGFTQFWILPAGGANAKNIIHLGVSNMESSVMQYELAVDVDGKVVKDWPAIDLNPNQKWEATLVLPQTPNPGIARVEALLYRAEAPSTIYRHVTLWLTT